MKDTMELLDKKAKQNIWRYILQCTLATCTILAILFFLDVLTETAIIAALGATAFIVFAMPNTYSSDPRRLIGGYIFGIITGFIFNFLSENIGIGNFIGLNTPLIVFGALSVGMAIFLMAMTNTEHAPAAGVALGLVINRWDYMTIIYILSAILLMALIRKILKSKLMNLSSM
jgi:CBS-domain-containing membrane protein